MPNDLYSLCPGRRQHYQPHTHHVTRSSSKSAPPPPPLPPPPPSYLVHALIKDVDYC